MIDRGKTKVVYNDGLTERQFLRQIEMGADMDDIAAAGAKKRARLSSNKANGNRNGNSGGGDGSGGGGTSQRFYIS